MKHIKTSLFLLFSAICSSALSNPKPESASINSLSFTQDSWIMDYRLENVFPSEYDSILFITHTDTSILDMSVFDNLTHVDVRNQDILGVKISEANLSKPLPLKQSGGYLYIKWYRNGYDDFYYNKDTLKYGTEPGACIRAPKDGEYISFSGYRNDCGGYTLCNDHSCSIQIKGKIYNADGTLLKNVQPVFSYDQPEYTTDSEGNYVKYLSVDTIKNISSISFGYYKSYPIETITIDGNPGDVINQDIHLKKMYVSEKEVGQPEVAMFFTYPNPASKEIHFSYRILAALSDCTIDIFSTEGMLVGHLPIRQQEGDVPYLLGDAFPAGSYTYSVSNNKTIIYRGRFFVQ